MNLEEALVRIADLEKILFEEPKLKKLSYTSEGGFEIGMEHWAIKHMACSVAESLLGGREPADANYAIFNLKTEIGPLEVTIQKCHGAKLTPGETIASLKSRLSKYEEV
jgi:hypothetical protein